MAKISLKIVFKLKRFSHKLRAKREQPKMMSRLLTESQGHDLAGTVSLYSLGPPGFLKVGSGGRKSKNNEENVSSHGLGVRCILS